MSECVCVCVFVCVCVCVWVFVFVFACEHRDYEHSGLPRSAIAEDVVLNLRPAAMSAEGTEAKC